MYTRRTQERARERRKVIIGIGGGKLREDHFSNALQGNQINVETESEERFFQCFFKLLEGDTIVLVRVQLLENLVKGVVIQRLYCIIYIYI